MKHWPILITALALSGCSHAPTVAPEPIITTIDVNKPVTVSCVPDSLGPAPEYPDTDQTLRASAGSPERFIQLLLAGRDLRIARSAEIEPVVKGCRK